MNRKKRDGMDEPKALLLNIIASVLTCVAVPYPFVIPVMGFLFGYYLAKPFGLLDAVRRLLNGWS